jgi:hypothetical protein
MPVRASRRSAPVGQSSRAWRIPSLVGSPTFSSSPDQSDQGTMHCCASDADLPSQTFSPPRFQVRTGRQIVHLGMLSSALPLRRTSQSARRNIFDCIVAPGSYTFAVLASEDVRGRDLIRFASPHGTPTFIETLAPRFTSIKRRGTSLDAYLFLRHWLSNFPKRQCFIRREMVRFLRPHGWMTARRVVLASRDCHARF